jgi:hypothetical protein
MFLSLALADMSMAQEIFSLFQGVSGLGGKVAKC